MAGAREELRAIPYLRGLDDRIAAEVLAIAVERSFAKGRVLFLEGAPCAGLHIVVRGRMKVFKVSPQGREQILALLGPGEAFNEAAALDGGPNPASAEAMTPATLLVLPCELLQDLIDRHPALARAAVRHLASHTRHLISLVEDLSFRTVSGRLARFLLQESGECEGVRKQWTQEEMASRLGTGREVISRALKQLEAEGLLRRERHQLVLLDRGRLGELADIDVT